MPVMTMRQNSSFMGCQHHTYQSVFILYLGSYLDKFLPHAPEIVSYSDDSDKNCQRISD